MGRHFTILEGADATGKSSFAEYLAETWPSSAMLHYGPPGPDWREDYYGRLAAWPALHTILDRSFIGSRVWSRVGYHAEPLDENNWRSVGWAYARHSEHVQAMVVIRDEVEIVAEIISRGEGVQRASEAIAGQAEFLKLLANNEVYYIPIAAHTSNRLHHMKEQG